MKKTILALLIFYLIFTAPCWASTGPEMTLSVGDDLSVLVTIDSGETLAAEAGAIIESGHVRNVYRDKMAGIFGSADNLSFTTSPTFQMSFYTDLVESEGGKYVISRKDFNGELDDVSLLKLELPSGYRFVGSDEAPDRVDGSRVTWSDVDGVPDITFEEAGDERKKVSLLVVGALFIALILFLIVDKKTST